ncbi:MAG TPA: MarR family transcriptional regulator [Candidatus Deferrimicrobium sp.]|nr:MarR family transcriptional regulator [Candidatus Deferrimicrobium sp.]
MTPQESQFVEEMGQFLGSFGMTPMSGRMWGWLLICEPEEQTAADIAAALHASRGAISGTARLLATAGMIRRTTRPGDRREYFSAPPHGLESMLASAGAIYHRLREIAERGLAATADRGPNGRARLEEFRDVMAFVEREVPLVIGQFLAERAAQKERLAG